VCATDALTSSNFHTCTKFQKMLFSKKFKFDLVFLKFGVIWYWNLILTHSILSNLPKFWTRNVIELTNKFWFANFWNELEFLSSEICRIR
jgi:hypothetical protein